MPAVGETGRRVVVRKPPKKKPQPKPVIRAADTGDRARGRPEPAPTKVRQYAHPQRKGPRKAMRAVAREENTKETQRTQRLTGEKFGKDRLRREVSRIRVTPVPSPDARDTLRSPAQKARDRAAVASSVRSSRVKAIRAGKVKPTPRPTLAYDKSGEPIKTRKQFEAAKAAGTDFKKTREKGRTEKAAFTAPVLKVLEQTTRPLHGASGLYRENVRAIKKDGLKLRPLYAQAPREKAGKAFVRGLQNKDKFTTADVLSEAGWKPKGTLGKVAKGVVSFTGDVVGDPTTYVTGGGTSAARLAATSAARAAEQGAAKSAGAQVAREKATAQAAKHEAGDIGAQAAENARKAGHTKTQAQDIGAKAEAEAAKKGPSKQAKKAGKRAVRAHARRAGAKAGEAAKAGKPTNTGLRIGYMGRDIPGVTRVTSAAKRGPRAVARKTGAERTKVGQKVDRAQQSVRNFTRNLGSEFNPAIAPAGVDRELYQAARRSARTARAGAQRGTFRAGQRAIAFRKAIGPTNYAKVIDAIETGTISDLPKDLRGPAHELQRDFAQMRKAELRSGLKVGDITRAGAKVEFPSGPIDTDVSAKELGKAQRAEAAAQRAHEAATQAHDIHQGRAEVLSRNVSGSSAEKAAERGRRKRKVRTAPRYAAGGHGVSQTAQAVRDAEHELGKATAAREAAQAAHETTKQTAREHRKATAAQEAIDKAPAGYVPHLRIRPEEPRRGARSVGDKKVNPSFGKSRIEGTVAEKNVAEPGAYSEDVAEIYVNRGAESATARAKAKLNQSMVNAGHKPTRDIPIKNQVGDGEALYKVDGANLVKIDIKSKEARELPKDGKYVILNEKLIDRTRGTVGAQAERGTAGVVFDRAQGVWKLTATQINPGYHVRNLAGEGQNAYLAENPIILGRNAFQAARALRQLGRDEEALRVLGAKPKGKRYAGIDITEAENVGAVRAGQLGREIGEMLGSQSKKTRVKARRGTLRKPARVLKNVEDVFRLASYKGGIDRGLTPEQAMQRASRYHFDYGDLTPLERTVLRRAFPFWTFSSRNIPLQARALLQTPGKYANYQKVREGFANAFGVPSDWEKDVSPSEQRSAAVPVKIGGKTYGISLGPSGLPLTDLNEFPTTANPLKLIDEYINRGMSMLTPGAKTPVEIWSNMSFFFRAPVEKDSGSLVPAPSWVKFIPEKYRKELGITDQYRNKQTGKSTWGAPARTVYALGIFPGPIAFGNRMMTQSEKKGQTKTGQVVQYLGPRVRQTDPLGVSISKLFADEKKLSKDIETEEQKNHPDNGKPIGRNNQTPEWRRLYIEHKKVENELIRKRVQRGDPGIGRTGSSSSNRVSIPGTGGSGRVTLPGASGGRVKVP